MICYFCDRAVSLACSCGRYVCRGHAIGTFCSECRAEQGRAEAAALERDENARLVAERERTKAEWEREAQRASEEERDRQEHWCDFCSNRVAQTTPKCRKCQRRFCDLHGQVLILKTMPNPYTERFCFERCEDHLFRRRLLGRHEKPTTIVDWIFRGLKSEADKHFGTGYMGMGG